jgi:hypothetical protein
MATMCNASFLDFSLPEFHASFYMRGYSDRVDGELLCALQTNGIATVRRKYAYEQNTLEGRSLSHKAVGRRAVIAKLLDHIFNIP